MTVDEIKTVLEDRNFKVVAKRTGVNYHTILRIAHGDTAHPRHDVMVRLIEYFDGEAMNGN